MKQKPTYQELEKDIESLQNKLKGYQKLIDNSSDIVWKIDLDFKLTFVSSAIYDILGYTAEEWLGNNLSSHKEFLKKVKNELSAIKDCNNFQSVVFESKMSHKNGTTIELETVLKVICDSNGLLEELIGSSRDITERKRKEQGLKEIKERLKMILDVASLGTWERTFDGNDNLVLINSNYADFLQIETKGKDYIAITTDMFESKIHPDDVEKFRNARRTHIQKETEFLNVEIRVLSKNSEYSWVLIVGKLMNEVSEDGKRRFVGLTMDINKLKQVEKKLVESNASKDRFFSIVAHDLRAPFNSLLGFSNLLMEELENINNPEVIEYSTFINQTLTKSYDYLNNLLEWTHSQINIIEYKPEKVKILSLVHEIIKVVKLQAENKKILIKTQISDELIISLDNNMIKTVVLNLISNAIKYSHIGGEIIISAKNENEFMIFSVADKGVGIEEDTYRSLFSIEDSKSLPGTKNEKGTGLGLILCKEFIEKHKGEIGVDSKFGKGSVFWFKIPTY